VPATGAEFLAIAVPFLRPSALGGSSRSHGMLFAQFSGTISARPSLRFGIGRAGHLRRTFGVEQKPYWVVDEEPARARRWPARCSAAASRWRRPSAARKPSPSIQGRLHLIVAAAETAGVCVAELLRTAGRMPVPVILVSAQGTIADAVAAMQNGARDYLVAPVSSEHLVAAARNAMGAEPAASAGRAPPNTVSAKNPS